jgi:hypothetical protein
VVTLVSLAVAAWFPRLKKLRSALEVGELHAASRWKRSLAGTSFIVEEVRNSEPPSFAELGPQIQQGLLQQAFIDAISGLRESAEVSYELEGLEPPAE